MTVDIDRIRAAATRVRGRVRRTPMLSSPAIDAAAGRRVFVKAECLQFTGSFKARGGWAAVSALSDSERRIGVLAFSSGNHAQGVARAAQALGVPATIVMPSDAPAVKIVRTREYGADVVLYDRATADRQAIAAPLIEERGLTLIPPFDHPEVIAGQGGVGLEVAEQAAENDVRDADVLVCCGGGGLSAGIALALEADAPGLRVRTVEPQGFDDVARSLDAGERLANPRLSGSICDAILTPAPGELTFPILRRLVGPGLRVSDDEALAAMRLAFEHLRIVLEPGGAVSLAAAINRADQITGDAVVVVATGGNVDGALFARTVEGTG